MAKSVHPVASRPRAPAAIPTATASPIHNTSSSIIAGPLMTLPPRGLGAGADVKTCANAQRHIIVGNGVLILKKRGDRAANGGARHAT